jgi:hypothetical protein
MHVWFHTGIPAGGMVSKAGATRLRNRGPVSGVK